MSEDELRATVKAAIKATSVNRVARALQLSAETTARFAGGLPVQQGTIALAKQNAHNLPTG